VIVCLLVSVVCCYFTSDYFSRFHQRTEKRWPLQQLPNCCVANCIFFLILLNYTFFIFFSSILFSFTCFQSLSCFMSRLRSYCFPNFSWWWWWRQSRRRWWWWTGPTRVGQRGRTVNWPTWILSIERHTLRLIVVDRLSVVVSLEIE